MMRQISSTHNSKCKIIVKRVINLLLVIILIASVLSVADKVTRPRYSDNRFGEFFEADQEYDVLFFGSSHMLHSINPMLLWKEYGLTSYNWAGYATWTPAAYWIFRNAIEYHKPKVAVLEVFGGHTNMDSQDPSMLHYTYDAFPLSTTKIKAAKDLFSTQELREEILIPFNIYHGKWNTVTAATVIEASNSSVASLTKGTEFYYGIYEEAEERDYTYTWEFDPETGNWTDGQKYIVKFIETCREEGIQPVLLYVPYNVVNSADLYTSLSKEYNVPYFDYYKIGNEAINYQTDLHDRAHLNFSGAIKITKLLGKELVEIIQPCYDEKRAQKWDSYYQNYMEDLHERVYNAQELQELLMYTSDPMFRVTLCVNNMSITPICRESIKAENCEVIVDNTVTLATVAVYDSESDKLIMAKDF